MKTEQTQATKIKLTELDGLDPVSVILEDIGLGKGSVVIECYNEVWSSYWGAMGGRTISEFFCSCDDGYLSKNLSNVRSTIDDFDGLAKILQKQIIQNRVDGDVDKETAREQYDAAETVEPHSEQGYMHDVLGDEWWYRIPSKPNPDYEYLCRIINVVKAALKQLSQPPKV